MSVKVRDLEKQFMCCGQRMTIMPYAGIWAIGCVKCDEPVEIIDSLTEIGGN